MSSNSDGDHPRENRYFRWRNNTYNLYALYVSKAGIMVSVCMAA
jgi:hypothetical protein